MQLDNETGRGRCPGSAAFHRTAQACELGDADARSRNDLRYALALGVVGSNTTNGTNCSADCLWTVTHEVAPPHHLRLAESWRWIEIGQCWERALAGACPTSAGAVELGGRCTLHAASGPWTNADAITARRSFNASDGGPAPQGWLQTIGEGALGAVEWREEFVGEVGWLMT